MDDLSIILPVYNERKSISIVLREWHQILKKNNIIFNFVISEDGSTDGTKEILQKLKKKYPLYLNQKNNRRGYSQALIDGILTSKSRYILCIDSDGQCSPGDFPKFWREKDKADILIGNRTYRSDDMQRKFFSLLFKIFFRILFPNSIKDPSAPFVLFRRQTVLPFIRSLNLLREGFWWGFMACCVKNNLTIYEIPISHRKRIKGDTQIYHLKEIPAIALRNMIGLFRLRFI